MSVSPVDIPTIVLGLGAFGGEVVRRLEPLAGERLGLLSSSGEQLADTNGTIARVLGSTERFFALGSALKHGAASLDVFVVIDLDDPDAAAHAPELVEELGRRLLERYSHILGRHAARRLSLAPVVVLSGARTRAVPADARRALARFETLAGTAASDPATALLPRVLVLEPQSARYELSPAELESTVVSFFVLLLTTTIRHEEPLRGFLKAGPEQAREGRCFASFGCATLELPTHQYVAASAALDVLRFARTPPADVASRAETEASRLLPTAEDLVARVRGRENEADLVELLRRQMPAIDLPSIGWRDTPEHIRDVLYGWGWFDALEQTIAQQVHRLDQSEMDELSRVADERGSRMARELLQDVEEAIERHERDGALGFWRALRLAQRGKGIAERVRNELERDLRTRTLVPFPKATQVESALRALREESTRRPRPYRLMAYAVLAAVLASLLLMHLPKWIVVALLGRQVPLLSLAPSIRDVVPTQSWQIVLEAPWSFLLVLAVLLPLALTIAGRYQRRRHDALLEARSALEAAVNRFLTDRVSPSVLGFYESRLALALRAWALRAFSQAEAAFDREYVRLTALENALSRLQRSLEADVKRLESAGRGGGSDLVYRRFAPRDALRQAYAAVRPSPDVAERILAELGRTGDQARDEAPRFLIASELTAAIAREVPVEPHVLRNHLGGAVVGFVEEMAERLSVPLEVHTFDDQTAERSYVFAPDWCRDALDALRQRLPSIPEVLPTTDDSRVFVLALRVALPREAIVVLERAS